MLFNKILITPLQLPLLILKAFCSAMLSVHARSFHARTDKSGHYAARSCSEPGSSGQDYQYTLLPCTCTRARDVTHLRRARQSRVYSDWLLVTSLTI